MSARGRSPGRLLFGMEMGDGRLPVALILASILALEMADMGALSAVAGSLKHAFAIDNTGVGLLLASFSFATAAATLPLGSLVDRMRRKTILLVAVPIWATVEMLSGAAGSYTEMLVMRVLLGVTTAIAAPCVASLTGDFFEASERADVYGPILAGEMIGVGVGFFTSGEVSSLLGWRWSFYVLALPSVALFWAIWRYLPEPDRGLQKWDEGTDGADLRAPDAAPRDALVLHSDPAEKSLWWAIRYCLRIPTYRLLILASGLAYYFFSGFRAFGMIYVTHHYGLSRSVASALIVFPGAGGLIGTVVGGRIAGRLLRRGRGDARIVVPAVTLAACIPPLGLAIWTSSIWFGLLMLTLGGAALAAALAPMDAARLDIMHPRLWGRAEAGRLAIRAVLEGSAPLLFGFLSGVFGGGVRGLMWTILLMLAMVLAASLMLLPARRTYPRDLATAIASQRRPDEAPDGGDEL